ncbi:MAG: YegS/Rv2252/BmrU family lipid kinase [Flavobacteriales bacterium]|nr:YegS/Rv2252/BmrU family lipid kinase [Flavobacteriales bacterium]
MSGHDRQYYFIINPISGGKDKSNVTETIASILEEKKIKYDFGWWNNGVSVKDLIKDATTKGFNTLVAVGGDGTINHVARELIYSRFYMGIIPLGSGNGFARHLGIKGHLNEQVEALINGKVQKIDSGSCNGQFFINVSGVGFDAHISHLFASSKNRGLANYAKLSLREGRTYKEEDFQIEIDGKQIQEKAFLISIANGSQWGNEFHIAPDAELNDGKLHCCLLKKPPLLAIPVLIKRFLTGDIAESKYYKDLPFSELVITRKKKGAVHLDGEPHIMDEVLNYKVLKDSINILENN